MVRVRRAAKKGGGAKKRRGCEKKGGAPHPPFFKKGGARSTGTPPVYATGTALYTFHPSLGFTDVDRFVHNFMYHLITSCTVQLRLSFRYYVYSN